VRTDGGGTRTPPSVRAFRICLTAKAATPKRLGVARVTKTLVRTCIPAVWTVWDLQSLRASQPIRRGSSTFPSGTHVRTPADVLPDARGNGLCGTCGTCRGHKGHKAGKRLPANRAGAKPTTTTTLNERERRSLTGNGTKRTPAITNDAERLVGRVTLTKRHKPHSKASRYA
jgi:hypothetical protein